MVSLCRHILKVLFVLYYFFRSMTIIFCCSLKVIISKKCWSWITMLMSYNISFSIYFTMYRCVFLFVWANFNIKYVQICSDSEGANVIVTAGHKGLKFWDIRYVGYVHILCFALLQSPLSFSSGCSAILFFWRKFVIHFNYKLFGMKSHTTWDTKS